MGGKIVSWALSDKKTNPNFSVNVFLFTVVILLKYF
jgi:hypothetical protein